ncbi:MAG: hypothetical protein CMJ29_07300 [Phycisphaerae bacterium]|nr:hypothetical protein [Phycisphaerae bacterium]
MSDPRESSIRPVFIAGRQHSGNTVMAVLMQGLEGWYVQSGESVMIEIHGLIDRDQNPRSRAEKIIKAIKLEDTDQLDWLESRVHEMAGETPFRSTLDIYSTVMGELVKRRGDRQWGQKATSYIFHADELLEHMPGGRMIYLLRNPWDLAASKKRRNPSSDRSFGLALSWAKGIQIAHRLNTQQPDRFKLVRYEDLVTNPGTAVKDLCEWLGEPFSEDLLDVPHVNPSENKVHAGGHSGKQKLLDKAASDTEAMESQGEKAPRGLNRSKMYQYADRLDPHEIAIIDQCLTLFRTRELLKIYYPDLPHTLGSHPISARARASISLPVSPVRFGLKYLTQIKRSPFYVISRTMRRFRA